MPRNTVFVHVMWLTETLRSSERYVSTSRLLLVHLGASAPENSAAPTLEIYWNGGKLQPWKPLMRRNISLYECLTLTVFLTLT